MGKNFFFKFVGLIAFLMWKKELRKILRSNLFAIEGLQNKFWIVLLQGTNNNDNAKYHFTKIAAITSAYKRMQLQKQRQY